VAWSSQACTVQLDLDPFRR
jgi:hypothetical protein